MSWAEDLTIWRISLKQLSQYSYYNRMNKLSIILESSLQYFSSQIMS